jgi:hypothetical protein
MEPDWDSMKITVISQKITVIFGEPNSSDLGEITVMVKSP